MSEKNSQTILQRMVGSAVDLAFVGRLANTPPISWVLRHTTKRAVRQATKKNTQTVPKINTQTTETVSNRPAAKYGGASLEEILQGIAYDVVDSLGYTGAMVATLEPGDELAVRASHVDPNIATLSQIEEWENTLSNWTVQPVSLLNPAVARVKLHDETYARNLSYKAAKTERQVVDTKLFSLFTPIVPQSAKPIIDVIQEQLGIKNVIAMPFFLRVEYEGEHRNELVGNLFAARDQSITSQDIRVLSAFARQAAAAIESERRRQQSHIKERIVSIMHMNIQDEQKILNEIVRGVVRELKFVGAIVASYEAIDRSLPVRAFYVDPRYATERQILRWEATISRLSGRKLSLSDPENARTYVDLQYHKDNLSVKAVQSGKPLRSNDLFDLFTPFVPQSGRPIVRGVQDAVGIQQVIAVPFYLHSEVNGKEKVELLGNLFAATRSNEFSAREIEMLQQFGQQAAIGIKNARLYRETEERRVVAQALGMEAFTSAAHVHELGNLIAPVSGWISFLSYKNPETLEEYQKFHEQYMQHLAPLTNKFTEVKEIIDTLRQPWRYQPQKEADFKNCLDAAIDKVERLIKSRHTDDTMVPLEIDTKRVADDLPSLKTSPDMLKQALVTILQNSAEAIVEGGDEGKITVKAIHRDNKLFVHIEDNGVGIRRSDLRRVFEMQYTTKDSEHHRGFGLYWTKDYIEGLGGAIQVISRWKEGTVVQLRLPAEKTMQDVLSA